MVVLINAVSAKSGGAAAYLQNLTAALGRSKHRFIVCVPTGRKAVVTANVDAIETDVAYRSPIARLLWDQIQLRRIITRERVDVVVSSSDFGVLGARCPQVLLVRNPTLFSRVYRDEILPQKTLRFRAEFVIRKWLVMRSIRAADIVVTATQSMMNDILEVVSVPESRRRINHFGVPAGKFTSRSREGTAIQRLLYVAEYSDYKDLTTLLRATQRLHEAELHSFEVVTTADPSDFPDADIITRVADRALLAQPGVSRHVRIVSRVPYERVHELYEDADVLVFPSRVESFGHPLIEAMAAGMPIVAADTPVHREVCANVASYFPPGDAQGLADMLLRLLPDRDQRHRMIADGRMRVVSTFDWSAHVARFLAIVDEVAGRTRQPAHRRVGSAVAPTGRATYEGDVR